MTGQETTEMSTWADAAEGLVTYLYASNILCLVCSSHSPTVRLVSLRHANSEVLENAAKEFKIGQLNSVNTDIPTLFHYDEL